MVLTVPVVRSSPSPRRAHRYQLPSRIGFVVALASQQDNGAHALSCFSEMNFGWCEYNRINPGDPPNCPNYTFSIATFQQKLFTHYDHGGRPPLMEAWFLSRLHSDYKTNLVDLDCPTPLVFAHFLVGEMLLIAPPWNDQDAGVREYTDGMALAKKASPFQQHLMVAKPPAWPFKKAMEQVQRAHDIAQEAFTLREMGVPQATVHLVVAHCREPLDWLQSKMDQVPPTSVLYVYEKCGEITQVHNLPGANKFAAVRVIPRPDVGNTRGDECSAYLSHIVAALGERLEGASGLADYTVFLQSDPHEHMHFDLFDLVLRSIAAGTYNSGFLHLNGPRHVRTLTPCLQTVHEELFGMNLTSLIGPYCCAQFVVSRNTIRRNTLKFYQRMLDLVDGTLQEDLCGIEGTKRSTHCYGYEFLWHIVFGEAVDPPNREDDRRLPVALRLKHGKEHTRLNWNGVSLARDIPIKRVPDFEHGNPLA